MSGREGEQGVGRGRDRSDEGSFRWASRWSLRGAGVVGGLFLAVAVVRTVLVGGGLVAHLAPTLAVTAIGATVGGLAGPLVGGGLARRRAARKDAREAEE